MKNLIRTLVALAPIAAATAAPQEPADPAPAPEPLTATDPAPLVRGAVAVDSDGPPAHPDAVRVRPVRVERATLERLRIVGPAGFEPGAVEVELFPGEVHRLSPTRFDRTGARAFTASGTLVDDPAAHWALAVRGSVVLFNLRPHDGTVHGLRIGTDGQPLAVQVLPPPGRGCGCRFGAPSAPGLDRVHGRPERGPGPPEALAAAQVELQLLVLLTRDAVDDLGGGLAARTAVELAVEEANQVFQNSEIDARWKLEAAVQVPYDETGASLPTHLNRLTNDSDGFIDEIHEYRGVLGADFVSLVVDDTDAGQFGGFGWVQPPPPTPWPGPFSIVHTQAMLTNLTLPHELGHNMGLGHELATNPVATTITPDANGWQFTGLTEGDLRTVLAIGTGTRIPHYSDPQVKYDGEGTGTTGNPGADAAGAVRSFLWLYPTFGASGIPADLPNSFCNFGAGPVQFGAFNTPFDKLMESVLQVQPAGGSVFVGGGGETAETPLLWFERELRVDANDPQPFRVGS